MPYKTRLRLPDISPHNLTEEIAIFLLLKSMRSTGLEAAHKVEEEDTYVRNKLHSPVHTMNCDTFIQDRR